MIVLRVFFFFKFPFLPLVLFCVTARLSLCSASELLSGLVAGLVALGHLLTFWAQHERWAGALPELPPVRVQGAPLLVLRQWVLRTELGSESEESG